MSSSGRISRSASEMRSVPDVLFRPVAVVIPFPNSRIPKSVGDGVEFLLGHSHVFQPPLEIAGLDVIIGPYHGDALLSCHLASANVFACVVRGSPIAELDELQVVVNAVLVHVIEVRE